MFEENEKQLQSGPGSQSPKNLTSAAAVKEFMLRGVAWPKNEEPGYINLEYQVKNPQRDKPIWISKSVKQIDAFLALAKQKSNEETVTNIYFCLSRQAMADKRKSEDAQAFKAAWLDLDVKEKGYATIEEAIDALFEFIEHYRLPPPSAVVVSGNGLHVYWFSTRPLSYAEWRPYAEGLKAAALQWGLKCDAGVIADAARVLRVPGTRNFKTNPPKRVYLILLRDEDIDFAASLKPLLDVAPAPRTNGIPEGLIIADAFKHLRPQNVAAGIAIDELPPLPFDPIKAECGWLREAHETGGKDYDQPQWNLKILCATFMENGHELAHALGNKHPEYSIETTDEIWERKNRERKALNLGWPSCKAIRDAQPSGQPSVCDQCPHFSKGKSPLNLALHQQEPSPTEPVLPLPFINFASWDHEPLPEYEWAVPGRYPLRQTVLSTGEGAVGKSILKLQLTAAHALCGDWLGVLPAPGPAIFVDAEEDINALHIRLAAILRHYGATFADAVKGGLHLISLAGHDAVLGAPTRNGKIEPTTLYKQLLEAAGDIKPKMIAIASSADVFAGNEIDRSQVRQFVSLMTRIAIVANGTVCLIGHPSLTGINTGTGLSGNTAWHNSVRARDYMTNIKPSEEGEQPDTDLRQLMFKKNQYGPVAETILLRYQNGLFLPEAGVGVDRAVRQLRADEIFLELLHRLRSENRYVSANRSAIYAPAIFAKEDVARKARLNGADFATAMVRLFAAKKVWNEPYGKPSRPSYRIAPAAAGYTTATEPPEKGPTVRKDHKEQSSPDRPSRYRR